MTTRSTLTLRGSRNQCSGCGLHFNSNHAFDMHRTGTHGVDRRCLTEDDMTALGMVRLADGFWVSKLRETKE